jgi:hypothetical protein
MSYLVRCNDAEGRVEMHLEAACDICFAVEGRHFSSLKSGQRTPASYCAPAAGLRSQNGSAAKRSFQ